MNKYDFYNDSFKTSVYDENISNGDPVIVYNKELGPVLLGTGFESMEDLLSELVYVMNTGNPSSNIIPSTAKKLEGSDNMDIFVGPSATLQKNYEVVRNDL